MPIVGIALRKFGLASVAVAVIGFGELNRVKVKSFPIPSRRLLHELKQLVAVFVNIWANPAPSETIAQVMLARQGWQSVLGYCYPMGELGRKGRVTEAGNDGADFFMGVRQSRLPRHLTGGKQDPNQNGWLTFRQVSAA